MLLNAAKKHIKRFWVFVFFVMPVHLFAQQKNLDYFLTQGIQNSPLTKETNNNILLNRIDSLRILATYRPQVNGISNNSYAPIINGYGYDEIITNIQQL